MSEYLRMVGSLVNAIDTRDKHKERDEEMKISASSISVADDPLPEIEDGICSTFDISNSSSNHSWTTGREKDDKHSVQKYLKTLGGLKGLTSEKLREEKYRRRR
jgi:hypothetical protein